MAGQPEFVDSVGARVGPGFVEGDGQGNILIRAVHDDLDALAGLELLYSGVKV